MNIVTEDITYELNVAKLTEDMEAAYVSHIIRGEPLPNGIKVNTNRDSLGRLLLKQIMTPIIIPLLNAIMATKGEELKKPKKHADLIDFCIIEFIQFIGRHGNELKIYVTTTSQIDNPDCKVISSVSTKRTDNTAIPERSTTEGNDTLEEKN